ncbi:hypothetical protein JG688_00018665 [Phytophthora aleatoria]|uniref:Tc1-like transposase DDE domain-containing protein n=1 Tax=Phytophthora aleatoria TaxID=2496075 RepID=A0A8J5LUF9_9STRA|nr:hypothetical protein JG688_00018665 [Phytophthora aleatoria]
MLRKRGYSIRGKTVAIRGDFGRKPQGTFDRVEFVKCCRSFAFSKRGRVHPGPNSVWILDGAAIHRHPEIIHFLRRIEYLFGYVKKQFQRQYVETSGRDLLPFVVETFGRFEAFEMSNVFRHCGWMVQGYFNPVDQLEKESRAQADDMHDGEQVSSTNEDDLDFFR